MSFRNQTIIVTGAASGIGRCIALTYAKHVANVVIADIDEINGQKVSDEIQQNGGSSVFVKTDVSVESDIVGLVNKSVQTFGGIDIIINNAGISYWKSPYELTVSEWDKIINTNLRSAFLLSREAGKYMKNRGGSIINIASTRAFMSEPDSEAYAASKGGIVALTHALAASFARDGIQVNCISPGWIENNNYDALSEADHSQHFAGRVGKPEDIANACLFMTNPANNFISGTNLTIDGGMTRKMIYSEDL